MDGLGTELGGGALLLAIAKIVRDVYVEWKVKKQAIEVVNNVPKPEANPEPEPESRPARGETE